MEEQTSSPAISSSMPASPPVKLWKPTTIGWVTFFLGFPGGIVLAAINWMRMGMRDKAIWHLVGGAVGTLLIILFVAFVPGNSMRLPSLLLNILVIYYLWNQIKTDIELFRASGSQVQDADGISGCVIGAATLLGFIVVVFVVVFMLIILGVPLAD